MTGGLREQIEAAINYGHGEDACEVCYHDVTPGHAADAVLSVVAGQVDALTDAMRQHFHGTPAAPYTFRGHNPVPQECAACYEAAEVAVARMVGRQR